MSQSQDGRVLAPNGQPLLPGEPLLTFPTLLLDGYFQPGTGDESDGRSDASDAENEAARKSNPGKVPTVPSVVEARHAYELEVPALKKQWVSVLQQWKAQLPPPTQAAPLAAKGVPPALRGAVWFRAIGNNMQVTASLYKLSLARAKELRAAADAAKPPPRQRAPSADAAPPSAEDRSKTQRGGSRARSSAARISGEAPHRSPEGGDVLLFSPTAAAPDSLGITPRKLHDPLTDTISSPPAARSRVATAADEAFLSSVRSRLDLASVAEQSSNPVAGQGAGNAAAAEELAEPSLSPATPARKASAASPKCSLSVAASQVPPVELVLGGEQQRQAVAAAASSSTPPNLPHVAAAPASPDELSISTLLRDAPPSPLALRVAGCGGSINFDGSSRARTVSLLPSPAAAPASGTPPPSASKTAAAAVTSSSSASRPPSHSSRARRYGAAAAEPARHRGASQGRDGGRERSRTGDSWYASEGCTGEDEGSEGGGEGSEEEELEVGGTDGCHDTAAAWRKRREGGGALAASSFEHASNGAVPVTPPVAAALLGPSAHAHVAASGGMLYCVRPSAAAPRPEADAHPPPRVKVPLDTGEASAATGAVLAAGPLTMLAPVSRHFRRRVWRQRWGVLLHGCLALYKAPSREAFRALLRGDESTPTRLDGPAAAAGRTGGIYLTGAVLGRISVPREVLAEAVEGEQHPLAAALAPLALHPGTYYAFEITLPERSQSCLFRVHSQEELLAWVGVLRSSTAAGAHGGDVSASSGSGNGHASTSADAALAPPVAPPLSRFFAHGEPLVLRQLRPAPRPSQTPTPLLTGAAGPGTDGSSSAATAPAAAAGVFSSPPRTLSATAASPSLSSTAVVMQRLDSFLLPHAVLASRATSRSASFSLSPSLLAREGTGLALPGSRAASRSASFSLPPSSATATASLAAASTLAEAGAGSGGKGAARLNEGSVALVAAGAALPPLVSAGGTGPSPALCQALNGSAAVAAGGESMAQQADPTPSASATTLAAPTSVPSSPLRTAEGGAGFGRRPRPPPGRGPASSPLLGGQASPLLTAALALPPAMTALQALGPTFSGEATHLSEVDVDLSRTFPEFAFFEQGSDFRTQLQNVLMAYAVHRPDQGYLQGMSHIAAILLLTVGSVNATESVTEPPPPQPASQARAKPRAAAAPAPAVSEPSSPAPLPVIATVEDAASPPRPVVALPSSSPVSAGDPTTPTRKDGTEGGALTTPASKPGAAAGAAARGLGTPSAKTPSTSQPVRRQRRRGDEDSEDGVGGAATSPGGVEASSPASSTPATARERRASKPGATPAALEDATAPLFDEDGVYIPMSARKQAAAGAGAGEEATSLAQRRHKRFGQLSHALHSLTHISIWRGKQLQQQHSRRDRRPASDEAGRGGSSVGAGSRAHSHRSSGHSGSHPASSHSSSGGGLSSFLLDGASPDGGDADGLDSPGFASMAGSVYWLPQQSSEVLVFSCLCNLLMRPPLRWAAARNMPKLNAWYSLYSSVLARVAPRVAAHLSGLGLDPSFYLMSWLITLFSNPLGLEVAIRLWDRVLLGGSEEVLKCAVGLTKHLGPLLLAGGPTAFEASFHTLAKVPAPLRDEFAISAAAASIKLTAAESAALAAMEGDLIE